MKKIFNTLIMIGVLAFSSMCFAETGMTPSISKYDDQCIMFATEDGTVNNRICGKIKVSNGSLTNNGDGTWSLNVGASGAGDLKADGTIPLTANWDVGNFDLILKNLTGDGTIEGAILTEGGIGVYNINQSDAVYEVLLNNEAGLYSVLSDVSDFVQGGEVNSIDSDMYVDDSIDDAHLNTGTGASQISAVDFPIADAGTIITATEIEGALQENRTAIDLNSLKVTYPGSADATELNILDGATLSTIEINYVDGVTSDIQTQINGKEGTLTHSAGLRGVLSDESGTGVAIFGGGDIGAGVATTPSADDDDTSIATTAYVQGEINGAGGTNLSCSGGHCNVDDFAIKKNIDDATTGSISIDSNTKKLYMGDSQDASIYSDGTDMILDDANIDPVTLQAIADYKGGWGFEDPEDTDDFKTIDYRESGSFDVTLGAIFCETDTGTVNFDLQIDDGTPADVNGTDIVCTSSGVLDSSLGGDVSFDAGDKIDLAITSVSGTPGNIKIFWFGKKKN